MLTPILKIVQGDSSDHQETRVEMMTMTTMMMTMVMMIDWLIVDLFPVCDFFGGGEYVASCGLG